MHPQRIVFERRAADIACLVVSQMVLFMALVWVLAFVLNRAEGEKATAQEALARSEKLLQQSQKMEAIGRLAGGVAHDFNNLLTVINGYAICCSSLGSADADRRSSSRSNRPAQRGRAHPPAPDASAASRWSSPWCSNINQTVGNLDKMLRRLINENIEFSFVLDPQLDRVKADPGQIEQIVLNLVVNARDAMPNGGTLRIQTKNVERVVPAIGPGASASRFVSLEVTDTGTGMDQKLRPTFSNRSSPRSL